MDNQEEHTKKLESKVHRLRQLRAEEHKWFSETIDQIREQHSEIEKDLKRRKRDIEDAYFKLLADYLKLKSEKE